MNPPNDYCQPGYCMVPGHPAEHDEKPKPDCDDGRVHDWHNAKVLGYEDEDFCTKCGAWR